MNINTLTKSIISLIVLLMITSTIVLAQQTARPTNVSPGSTSGIEYSNQTQFTFKWSCVTGSQCRLQVVEYNSALSDPCMWDENTGFDVSCIFKFDSNIGVATEQIVTLEKGKCYAFSVRAKSGTLQSSQYSARFYVFCLVDAPPLSSPSNGATVTSPVTLSIGSVTGANTYRIQISTSNSFNANTGFTNPDVYDNTIGNSTSLQKSLSPGTYYWTARGGSSCKGGNFSTPRSFVVKGAVTVSLSPNYIGAQWKLDNNSWQNSGDTVKGLNVGSYTINFNNINCYSSPSSIPINISDGTVKSESGTYTQQTGILGVSITPAEAVTAGAKWSIDNSTWQNSGASLNLVQGSYTVYFKAATGYNTPASQSITVNCNQSTSASGTYTGACIVTNPASGEKNDAACYLVTKGIIKSRADVKPDDYLIRSDAAKIIYLGVFGQVQSPAFNFPSYFLDIKEGNNQYHKYAVALSYLEYQDGIVPFNRDRIHFNPGDSITRKHFVKALLEAFNIKPDASTPNPFTDVSSTEPMYPYLKKAYSLGITTATTFRPADMITRAEAFVMLYRVLNSNTITKPTEAQLTDIANYFIPLDFTEQNFAVSRSLENGVFNTYSKGAFAINDIGFGLTFDINYNSYIFDNPKELYAINSLASGWSHNYDIRLIDIPAKGMIGMVDEAGISYQLRDYIVITYPNGSVEIYNKADLKPITKGVYSTLTSGTNQYILTTKNKSVLTFDKLVLTSSPYNNTYYNLSSIKDRNGNELKIVYNASNKRKIDYVQVPSGRKLTFVYDAQNRIVQVTDNSLTRSIFITYDANGDLATFKDALGKITTYIYYASPSVALHTEHLLSKIKLPKGNEVILGFEARKAKSIQTNLGNTISISHNSLTKRTDFSVKSAGSTGLVDKTYYMTFDATLGVPKSIINLSNTNLNTTVDYTIAGQPTLPSKITVNSIVSTYTYDANGNILTSTVQGILEKYEYDANNLLIKYTDALNRIITITRDAKGNVTAITDALGNITKIAYNDKGLPTSITNPEGIVISYVYNANGDLVDINAPLSLNTHMTYDKASRQTSVTIDGKTNSYEYDAADNLVKEIDALNRITQYQYDNNYNLVKIINAKAKETVMTYDIQNDWLTSVAFGGSTEQYSYLEDGSLQKITKPDSKTNSIIYDNKGRVKSNASITNTEYWEDCNCAGKIKSISNANGTNSFVYDNFNRLANYTDIFGNVLTYTMTMFIISQKLHYPAEKQLAIRTTQTTN